MAKVLTRHNAFIPEPTKLGHYSCPFCYRLAKGVAGATELQCAYCGLKAPILAGSAVAAVNAKDFLITGLRPGLQDCRCPACGFTSTGAPGLYVWICTSCKFKGNVSYREHCNACLMRGKLIPSTYICSNPAGRHSPGHNTGLKEAGKCDSCHCSYDCKKR